MMSEFKSGEDVLFNGSEYVYIAKHPIFPNLSVIQVKEGAMTLGGITDTLTGNIKKKPKVHTVNGFEVPAPMGESEFDEIEDTDLIYSFACNYYDGYDGILKCHTAIVSVKCGFVFRSESDIKKNIAALQGIDPSTVE